MNTEAVHSPGDVGAETTERGLAVRLDALERSHDKMQQAQAEQSKDLVRLEVQMGKDITELQTKVAELQIIASHVLQITRQLTTLTVLVEGQTTSIKQLQQEPTTKDWLASLGKNLVSWIIFSLILGTLFTLAGATIIAFIREVGFGM